MAAALTTVAPSLASAIPVTVQTASAMLPRAERTTRLGQHASMFEVAAWARSSRVLTYVHKSDGAMEDVFEVVRRYAPGLAAEHEKDATGPPMHLYWCYAVAGHLRRHGPCSKDFHILF